MYEYFYGEIIEKSPTHLVLDVNGVGYRFSVPLSTSEKLPPEGKIKILSFPYVRDEEMRLYGFWDPHERELFSLLLTVKGVGPQVALSILSSMGIEEFQEAVLRENEGLIHSVRGIGRKIAQRIILELKEPLARRGILGKGPVLPRGDKLTEDAFKALLALGYKKRAAQDAVQGARVKFPEINTVEELVRRALGFSR